MTVIRSNLKLFSQHAIDSLKIKVFVFISKSATSYLDKNGTSKKQKDCETDIKTGRFVISFGNVLHSCLNV